MGSSRGVSATSCLDSGTRQPWLRSCRAEKGGRVLTVDQKCWAGSCAGSKEGRNELDLKKKKNAAEGIERCIRG